MSGEKAGTPSVGIMTTAFVDGAELMARALGVTGYPFVVIDHPISSATDAELEARARATIEQAAALLLSARRDSNALPAPSAASARLSDELAAMREAERY